MTFARTVVPFAVVMLSLVGVGCEEPDELVGPSALLPGDEPVLFVAQGVRPEAVMQALYDGDVVVDPSGCIRLDRAAPDDATVVWPYRFTLSGNTVVDDRGGRVGDLGGRFRLGGGYVPQLWEGLGIAAAQAEALRARCPGSFWITGEIVGR